ncbi:MAG: hypothetical protein K2F87_00165 [Muribaculaceae bacterium]|nr:hypothetical protein [Muribaculaceae bacterium]
MINELITQFLIPAGTLLIGGAAGMLTKSGRIKAKADAMKAMADVYEARLASLHTIIENQNKTEVENSRRISELNHAINDKTDRIRELTDKGYESERELNRANERITTLTEQRDDERRLKEYYKRWRCEKSTCADPDGRRPPNSKLAAEHYAHPD